MRGLHRLADQKHSAYRTVWKRGGGTLVTNRHQQRQRVHVDRDGPSAYALFSVMRTRPPSRCPSRSCAIGGREHVAQESSRPAESSPPARVAARRKAVLEKLAA